MSNRPADSRRCVALFLLGQLEGTERKWLQDARRGDDYPALLTDYCASWALKPHCTGA